MEESYTSFTTPFVDAFRTAHENVTKEFDQFYGYISQTMSPRRSQRQSSNHVNHKTPSKTTKRIRQKLDEQHGSNTSMVSLAEQRSLSKTRPQTNQHSDDYSSRSSHSYSRYPQRIEKHGLHRRTTTRTPNTRRTYLALGSDHYDSGRSVLQQHQDIHSPHHSTSRMLSINTSSSTMLPHPPPPTMTLTPHRRTTSPANTDITSSLCISTPGVYLQDYLDEESRRIEHLYYEVRRVQQRTFALTHDASSLYDQGGFSFSNNDGFLDNKTGDLSYLRPLPNQSSYSMRMEAPHGIQSNTRNAMQTAARSYKPSRSSVSTACRMPPMSTRTKISPPSPPLFTTSTPLGSPVKTHQSLQPLQKHSLFSAPSPSHDHLLPSSTPKLPPARDFQRYSFATSPSKGAGSPLQYPRRQRPLALQRNPIDNGARTRILTGNLIRMPIGHRISDQFWENTEDDKSELSLVQDNTMNTRPASATANIPINDDDDTPEAAEMEEHGITVNAHPSSAKRTRTLMDDDDVEDIVAEMEQDMDCMMGNASQQQPSAKTLDQELSMARNKYDRSQEQQQQQQVEVKTFSLRPYLGTTMIPVDEEDDSQQRHRGTIDGDRWTFAGQHYTVDEKH